MGAFVRNNDALCKRGVRMSTILIVDDDKFLRKVLRETLEGEGYTVLEAVTAQEGLDTFSRAPCDLVLLDLVLPDLDGLEVLAS